MSVRVKICGVTMPADIIACEAAGADAVGINFHPGSKRYIDPQRCEALVRSVPPMLSTVGVFVDRPMHQMLAIARQLGLNAVQHHGNDPATGDLFPFRLVTAFRVRDDVSMIERYLRDHRPSAILVDAFVEGEHGGTGKVAPWGLLADLKLPVPLILAGGLTPDNVAEAVRKVRPWAVDVASGVESAPGIKDPEKVRAFVANAKGA